MILHHQFIRMAKKHRKKLAIADKTTDKNFTYSKTLISALIFSQKVRKFKENYIGVMVPTSAGCFLSVLGVLMAGKVPVMINYSTGAEQNSKYAQRKCGFKTILTSKALLEKINCKPVEGMIFLEDILESLTTNDKLAAASKSLLPANLIIGALPKATEEDDVVILFTSGSEKDPKAVQLCHRNITANIVDVIDLFQLSNNDAILSILPLFHVFGYTVDFWLPITIGMTAVTYANPLDYKKIPKLIRDSQVTMIAATPIFLAGYLRESDPGDFHSLRIAIGGADKIGDHLRESYMKKHQINLLEGYGATETSPVISANSPSANKPGSIGQPLKSVKVKITDIITGKPLPPGKEGKILVKGNNVMKGYFDDIEETSLRIEDGWYDTGDMGILDEDGYLWHRGRLKRFVKIGGEMVSLVKTETVLQDLLPDHIDCCVVEVPDPTKGARLVAAVTQKINEKDLIRKMGESLAPICIPKTFIVIEDMPKMGSGKIDFRSITDIVHDKLRG